MSKNKEGYVTLRTDEHCTECGCNLHLKTRALSAECPKKFWLKEATQKDEQLIKKHLKQNENNN